MHFQSSIAQGVAKPAATGLSAGRLTTTHGGTFGRLSANIDHPPRGPGPTLRRRARNSTFARRRRATSRGRSGGGRRFGRYTRGHGQNHSGVTRSTTLLPKSAIDESTRGDRYSGWLVQIVLVASPAVGEPTAPYPATIERVPAGSTFSTTLFP